MEKRTSAVASGYALACLCYDRRPPRRRTRVTSEPPTHILRFSPQRLESRVANHEDRCASQCGRPARLFLFERGQERRSIPQPGAGICTGNCLPRFKALRQAEANDADATDQAVHVSAAQELGLHPQHRYLPQRHQAAKFAPEPLDGRPEALRLRFS